jgi:hypothetical protein
VASETSDLTHDALPGASQLGALAPVHGLTKFRAVAPIEASPGSAGDATDAGLPEPSSPEPDPPELDDTPAIGRRVDDPKTGPRALGRLRLVKRRAQLPTESPQEPVNPIERLLGSF